MTSPPTQEFLPELEIDGPGRMNRLTVAFRIILAIPHLVVLYFLGIAAAFVSFIGWWAALFMGRLPEWAYTFLGGYLAWSTRVNAYVYLLADPYPPFNFEGRNYPVRLELQPGRLNRLAVFFRFILVIPAAFMSAFLSGGWAVCSFFLWLSVLITGRTPAPVFGASAAALRYAFRYQAYWMMLTSAYPKRVFGDHVETSEPAQQAAGSGGASAAAAGFWGTRPLRLTSGGRALLIIFIVLGVLYVFGSGMVNGALQGQQQQQNMYYHAGAVPTVVAPGSGR